MGSVIEVILIVGLLMFLTFGITARQVRKDEKSISRKREAELEQQIVALKNQIEHKSEQIQSVGSKIEILKNLRNEKEISYPWLAGLLAEYEYPEDYRLQRQLRYKNRPAIKAADAVSLLAAEKRNLLKQVKMYEHEFRVLTYLFPWIEDFVTLDIDSAATAVLDVQDSDEYSTLKNWLSPEEYASLSSSQKYQLALDRWGRRKKTDWEAGIDYERFIGYWYECSGYKVDYTGALEGLSDMGRDLIAQKGSTSLIVQCKRWSKEKIIREKHIFQLYGSTVLKQLQNPSHHYTGVFVTSATLSKTAKQCAEYLKIEVIEDKPLESYPLIKCNISKHGEKIYHLPFDQQYDRTQILSGTKDFYCWTVEEAEHLGYRHAFRWTSKEAQVTLK